MNDDNDSELTFPDDSSGEAEEGLQYLLGGLASSDFTCDAWDNQSLPDRIDSDSDRVKLQRNQEKTKIQQPLNVVLHGVSNAIQCDEAYTNAYRSSQYCNPNASRPPVRIVDLSSQGRGNILVATEQIERGQVIFTERAAVASQLFASTIRACQFCFRSLEPITSCCVSKQELLPNPHHWPILELDFTNEQSEGRMQIDRYGRRQCNLCNFLFCSQSCYDSFQNQMGNCCSLSAIQREIPLHVGAKRHEQVEDSGEDVEPALLLATRLFVANVQHYRATSQLWMEDSVMSMCGEEGDLDALELGQPIMSCEDGRINYSLQQLHEALVERLSVSAMEQETLSLEHLSRLASISARNGFGIMTQSPFRSYYAALLRSIGGRDNSDRHIELQQKVARALGAPTLQRGMDRQVDAKVAPEIVALFLLISRINHSCSPNAQVLSQEFIDNHVDLVALDIIEVGQEITISYIGTGPQSGTGRLRRQKRQRELQAKYLFHCACTKCLEEDTER